MLYFGATGFNLFEALYDYVLSETARHFPKKKIIIINQVEICVKRNAKAFLISG